MREYKMGYFVPVAPEKVAQWNDYREKVFAYREAVSALQKEIGASGLWLGIAGGVSAAKFDGKVHPAFSNQEKKNGAHVVLSRGRSEAQRRAIKEFEAKNLELAKLKPNPEKIATAHGFKETLSYQTKGGGDGWQAIGPMLYPIQALWFDPEGSIFIYAPDAKLAAEALIKASEEHEKRGGEESWSVVSTDCDDWKTPEGYERITETRWKFLKAEYEMKREEEKANEKSV